jgi:hypothetical protein
LPIILILESYDFAISSGGNSSTMKVITDKGEVAV